jgi:hypothetical protein
MSLGNSVILSDMMPGLKMQCLMPDAITLTASDTSSFTQSLRLQPFVFRVWIWAQQTETVRERFKTV